MMLDLWFGDSWTIGSELAQHYGGFTGDRTPYPNMHDNARPDLAFPTLVSRARQYDMINFAQDGGSYAYALDQLMRYAKNNCIDGCDVFLCTTGQTRDYGVCDITRKEQHFLPHVLREVSDRFVAQKSETRFATYDTTVLLNAFYNTCEMHGAVLHIIPVWCGFEAHEDLLDIPEHHWLYPRDKKLIDKSFYVDKQFPISNIEVESESTVNIFTELFGNEYIAPCMLHPNPVGHGLIAKEILNILNPGHYTHERSDQGEHSQVQSKS